MKRKLLLYIKCPVKWICNHLIGEDHHIVQRLALGTLIMVIGVHVAHAKGSFESNSAQMGVDCLGYLLHGIGAAPYVDGLKVLKDIFK